VELNIAKKDAKLAKVMIIDDDPTLRSLLEQAFRRNGYQTLLAQNGYEALALIEEGLPSIIILDLMMPVMDGWRFLELREKMEDLSRVPVIVITGLDSTGFLANITAKLTKPFDLFAILALIDKTLAGA